MSNGFFQFKQFTVWHDRCAMKVGADGVLLGAWASAEQVRRVLDVGCGAGALTIRCAKKFPEACCVGIDYWGIKWDYSQRMCQRNAVAEGVADHCTFQQGDANHLDFADGCFDAVVSNFVYHEIHDGKSREELLRG